MPDSSTQTCTPTCTPTSTSTATDNASLSTNHQPCPPEDPPDLERLLPVSFRLPGGPISRPSANVPGFLAQELLIDRFDAIYGWITIAGRPMPPKPLHYQLLMRRDLVLTEDPSLHLVFYRRRLFLKPLPAWLLDRAFWTACIAPLAPNVAACARGLLFSYCALVSHQSDFDIASARGLLPAGLDWPAWQRVAGAVMRQHSDGRHQQAINPRYRYAELDLVALNKIYFWTGRDMLGYSTVESYSKYAIVGNHLGALAGALAYVIVVLTSMQVGLGVDGLKNKTSFQQACYGFTVFAMIAPPAGLMLVLSGWAFALLCDGVRFKRVDRGRVF